MGVFLFSKSSRLGSRRQNRPDFRQQRLNRLPEPHGQRSLRPSFSVSSLSPWITRIPRLTFVSDGKPFRRLLIGSKKMVGRGSYWSSWDTSFVSKRRTQLSAKRFNLPLTEDTRSQPKNNHSLQLANISSKIPTASCTSFGQMVVNKLFSFAI
jgi:hypothetical protein